jgi:hypothetical protein
LAVYARHANGEKELEIMVGPRPAVPVASPEDQSGIAPVTPFFSIVLHDWLIERDVEEDLGARFTEAVGLLAEAAVYAKNHQVVGAFLPRTPVTRDELEVRVARYANEALDPDGSDRVSVSHRRVGAADSDVEEPLRLQICFGPSRTADHLWILIGSSRTAEYRFDWDSARLVDVKVNERGCLTEHWEAPDGFQADLFVLPAQDAPIDVELFSIRLYDWPLARQPERNLGPGFKRAVSLLVEACWEWRRWTFAKDAEQGDHP